MSKTQFTERYLRVAEVADQTRLSPFRVRQLLREKRLLGVWPGGAGSWRVPVSALDRFLTTTTS